MRAVRALPIRVVRRGVGSMTPLPELHRELHPARVRAPSNSDSVARGERRPATVRHGYHSGGRVPWRRPLPRVLREHPPSPHLSVVFLGLLVCVPGTLAF